MPSKDLFQDVVTVILMSWMGVSEMVVNVSNIVTVIYGIIHIGRPSFFEKIMTSNGFIHENR